MLELYVSAKTPIPSRQRVYLHNLLDTPSSPLTRSSGEVFLSKEGGLYQVSRVGNICSLLTNPVHLNPIASLAITPASVVRSENAGMDEVIDFARKNGFGAYLIYNGRFTYGFSAAESQNQRQVLSLDGGERHLALSFAHRDTPQEHVSWHPRKVASPENIKPSYD